MKKEEVRELLDDLEGDLKGNAVRYYYSLYSESDPVVEMEDIEYSFNLFRKKYNL